MILVLYPDFDTVLTVGSVKGFPCPGVQHYCLFILQHPLARIMCSCSTRQKNQSVIGEIVFDCRRIKSKNCVS